MDWREIDPQVRFFWEGRCALPWSEPSRRLYDCELVYVSDGAFWLTVGVERWRMTAGCVAIIPPAVWHESRVEPGEHAMRHCVHFDWNRERSHIVAPLQAFVDERFDERRLHMPPPALAAMLPLWVPAVKARPALPVLKFALDSIRAGAPAGEPLLWPVLRLLLSAGPDTAGHPAGGGKAGRAVLALKHHIDTHYDRPMGYPDFAEITRLSNGHLCQAFARIVGCAPTAYLNRVRLQHARRLLSESTLNVAEVGYAVGIQDANYFARLFKKHFGVSPSQFMRS